LCEKKSIVDPPIYIGELSRKVILTGCHERDRFQSRAFLLMPMTFNVGVIIGPILGGFLSDLGGTYPSLFGHIAFFERFPYAAPNILSAFFLLCAILAVWLCLEEVRVPSQTDSEQT